MEPGEGTYMDVTIREATLDDAEALRRYAVRLFAERPPGVFERPDPTLDDEREFVRSHDGYNSVLLLAEAEGAVVGLLALAGRSMPQEAHVGLVGVSVDSEWRGRGIGRRLFERLFEWAPAHGIERIEIEAFANNPDAVRLYERLGFEHEGVRRGAVKVDGEPVDVIGMARSIGG